MNGGLATTWEVLRQTKNDVAFEILIRALDDSPRPDIREGALRTLLNRRSAAGPKTLLARWHELSEEWKEIVAENPGRMSTALRDAVLDTDHQTCANGCDTAVRICEYDLIPTLINAAEDDANPLRDLSLQTLVDLSERLYEELSLPRDYSQRRDPRLVRAQIVSSLEKSVKRFGAHKRVEIIQAFLQLVGRDNATLKKILQDPHEPSFIPIINALAQSTRKGIMRLALSYLDDPHAPSSTVGVLSRRKDPAFLTYVFKKIGFEPSAAAKLNLRRMDSIDWVGKDPALVNGMDDACQHAAVQMVMASGMNRLEAFEFIRYLLKSGKPTGRRAAATALSEFNGAEANKLAVISLNDEDAGVQAQVAAQLRRRSIPGALRILIGLLESPHTVVRNAARFSLSEFTFQKFVATFDMLDEDVRVSTGTLVRKVDRNVVSELAVELEAPIRTRRLRGLEIARCIGMAEAVEDRIVGLMDDGDHMVRTAAARALDTCPTDSARAALRNALMDSSVAVQQAAGQSLQMLSMD